MSAKSSIKNNDFDSAQYAIQWLDADGNEVGHSTNALLEFEQRPFRAANWIGSDEGVWWNEENVVPPNATTVHIIVLYTDVLWMENDDHKDNGDVEQTWGDLPMILARWEGVVDSGTGAWSFTGNSNKGQLSPPTRSEIRQYGDRLQLFVREFTGFTLRPRKRENGDTGFEVVPR
jgi:hypothetical protein